MCGANPYSPCRSHHDLHSGMVTQREESDNILGRVCGELILCGCKIPALAMQVLKA